MRRLLAGVLLALWSSVAPAQTYDTLKEAVGRLTELLVEKAKKKGWEPEEEGIYVSPCDFREQGRRSGPFLHLSKLLGGMFTTELQRYGVTVVAAQGEGREMTLHVMWTRETNKERLFLKSQFMRVDDMQNIDRQELVNFASPRGLHVAIRAIDQRYFEADTDSPCNSSERVIVDPDGDDPDGDDPDGDDPIEDRLKQLKEDLNQNITDAIRQGNFSNALDTVNGYENTFGEGDFSQELRKKIKRDTGKALVAKEYALRALAGGEFENARTQWRTLKEVTPDSREVESLEKKIMEMESKAEYIEEQVTLAINQGEFQKAIDIVKKNLAAVIPESPRIEEFETHISDTQTKAGTAERKASAALVQGAFDEARRIVREELAAVIPESPRIREFEARISDTQTAAHTAERNTSAALERGAFDEARRIVREELAAVIPESPRIREFEARISDTQTAAHTAERNASAALEQGAFDEARRQVAALAQATPRSPRIEELNAQIERTRQLEESVSEAVVRGDFGSATTHLSALAEQTPSSPRLPELEQFIDDTQTDAGTAERNASAALARGAFDEARRIVREELAAVIPASSRIQELEARISDTQTAAHTAERNASAALVQGAFDEARRIVREELAAVIPASPRIREFEARISDTQTAAHTAERNTSAALERGAFDEARRIVREELAAVIPESPRIREFEAHISDTQTAAHTAEESTSMALERGAFDEARRQVEALAQATPRSPRIEELNAQIERTRQLEESVSEAVDRGEFGSATTHLSALAEQTPSSPRLSELEQSIDDTQTAAHTAEENVSATLARGAFDEARRIVREELAAVIPASPRIREFEARISDTQTAAHTAERNASAALARGAFDEARRIVREELAAPRIREFEAHISDTQTAAHTAERNASAALEQGAFDEARRQVAALAQATPRSPRIEELNAQIERTRQLEESVSEAVVRGDFGSATTHLGALAEQTPSSPRLPELEQFIDDTQTDAGTAERNASAALARGAFDEARRIVREELAAVIPASSRIQELEARISDTQTAAHTAERNASAALVQGAFDEARRIVREELAAVIPESPRIREFEARISDTQTAAHTAERNTSAALERGAFDEARRIVREELAAVIPESPRIREFEAHISDTQTAAHTAEESTSMALERGAFDEARRQVEALAQATPRSPRIEELNAQIERTRQLEESVSEAVDRGEFGSATTHLSALAEQTPSSPRLPELEQSIDDTQIAAHTAGRNASAALARGAFDEARRIVREELAAVIPESPRIREFEARISDTQTAAHTAERNASAALERGAFDEARRQVAALAQATPRLSRIEELNGKIERTRQLEESVSEAVVRGDFGSATTHLSALAEQTPSSPRLSELEQSIDDTQTAAHTAEENVSATLARGAFDEARRIVREELAAVIPESPRIREFEARISDTQTAAGTVERNASAALERGAFDEARRIVREELAAVIPASPRIREFDARISGTQTAAHTAERNASAALERGAFYEARRQVEALAQATSRSSRIEELNGQIERTRQLEESVSEAVVRGDFGSATTHLGALAEQMPSSPRLSELEQSIDDTQIAAHTAEENASATLARGAFDEARRIVREELAAVIPESPRIREFEARISDTQTAAHTAERNASAALEREDFDEARKHLQVLENAIPESNRVPALAKRIEQRELTPDMVSIENEGECFRRWGEVRVCLQNDFAIMKYEVTFEEYDRFVGETERASPEDSGWGRGRRPVINVSWIDATEYALWLSEKTDQSYRLPTETEWEYAARAGVKTKYPWGKKKEGNRANCKDCGEQWNRKTADVGQFQPNGWMLHDVVGNVREWTCSKPESPSDCEDDPESLNKLIIILTNQEGNDDAEENLWNTIFKAAENRVIRGGSWNDRATKSALTSEGRVIKNPKHRDDNLGFRLVRTLTP